MAINLKTKLNLPALVKSDSYLALPTNGRRGLCVSFFNPDALDIEALDFAKQLKESATPNELIYAADIGCSSYFPQAIRFARAGLTVDAFDIESPMPEYQSINTATNLLKNDMPR